MPKPPIPNVYSEVKGTKIIKVDPIDPDVKLIRLAAKVIREGGTVAFPTETVYGLGADALNSEAVKKIFKAKNRPADNPIIVHVSSREDLEKLSAEIPGEVDELIDRFWPGPLTFILKASDRVSRVTTGGLDTVAIRMPNHKVALSLISESGAPIAAPSANLAGKPSPTSAEHVIEDLAGRIDMVLDAGSTKIGVESTVVDMTKRPPVILRPGGTTYEELREILRELRLHPTVLTKGQVQIRRALSPGMKYRHYAPKAEVILVEGKPDAIIEIVKRLIYEISDQGKRVGVLAFDESKSSYNKGIIKSLGSRRDLSSAAKRVFSLLREFDEEKVDVIIAEGMPEKEIGLAVMNRLKKASGYKIIRIT